MGLARHPKPLLLLNSNGTKISVVFFRNQRFFLIKRQKLFAFSFANFLDVDECAVNKPCKNGGKCENSKGSYKCTCVGGWFTGKHCDEGNKMLCQRTSPVLS